MTHLDLDALAAGYAALPLPPPDQGRVSLLILRQPGELRVLPDRASATCDGGLTGDRWVLAANRKLEEQVTAMRTDVVRLMTNGGELSRFGDNLLVDLDLSERNLPVGTRLRIGSTLLEVTAKPHTGCKKFVARAGRDAMAMTRDPRWLADRLRGIHLRVLQAGDITVGDAIVKL